MNVLGASEVPVSQDDRVFRHARWRAVAIALLIVSAGIACFLFGRRQPAGVIRYVSYYTGTILLLGTILLHQYVTARFRPSNWLARVTAAGVFVQFRSYLNDALPVGDPTVVFFPYGEIRSARLLIERRRFVDAQGHRATQTVRFVEFDVAADVTGLAKALSVERARPGPTVKRWYGSSRTVFNDYPVEVEPPSFVRVQWSASPGAKPFLRTLAQAVHIAEPLDMSEDLTTLGGLARAEQEQRLRRLDSTGQTILAIALARRLYRYDLATAKAYVESLRSAADTSSSDR